ncbi:MAG: GNAT family N-acetyltransferase [Candidatus Limnocylindrales bacterium]
MTDTRVAIADDLEAVTATITLAFANDPVWGPATANAETDADRSDVWRAFLAGAMRYPWTWLTEGAGAVSVWIPPNGTEMSEEQDRALAPLLDARLGPGAADYLETLARFDAARPRDEPHYYLSLLGTHPDHRGRGLGMALLADNLARIDEEGAPAYLESTNPANDHRYASVGFEAIGSFVVPYHGHIVTTMWRPARTTRSPQ